MVAISLARLIASSWSGSMSRPFTSADIVRDSMSWIILINFSSSWEKTHAFCRSSVCKILSFIHTNILRTYHWTLLTGFFTLVFTIWSDWWFTFQTSFLKGSKPTIHDLSAISVIASGVVPQFQKDTLDALPHDGSGVTSDCIHVAIVVTRNNNFLSGSLLAVLSPVVTHQHSIYPRRECVFLHYSALYYNEQKSLFKRIFRFWGCHRAQQ